MKGFRSFAVASAIAGFALAVLGSWVRINGAGMTCPDWPLCRGTLVPTLTGGVVLEWSHRAVALLESFFLIGAIVTGARVRRHVAGVTPTLIALIAVFTVQVILGGATVHLANSPLSVMLHWGMAMALLAALTTLALLAMLSPQPAAAKGRQEGCRLGAPGFRKIPLLPIALAAAAGFGFIAMCLGAYVSSSFAGLACPSFPDCRGTLLGENPAQHLQMLHRLAATAFTTVAFAVTLYALQIGSTRVKACVVVGTALLLLQIGLGAFNVALHLPIALREAHAANACLTFLAFVVASVTASIDTAHERMLDLEPA